MTLVLAAHGTRDPAGATVAHEIAEQVRVRLRGVAVLVAFADVRAPDVGTVLGRLAGPAVVVPAFLASGYHVRVDIPAQVGGRALITAPLGPAPGLVAAAHDRLISAGWRPGDTLVLAAAGSSDPRALADVRRAAVLLGARTGSHVRIGYVTTTAPRVGDLVGQLPGRVAVASWLLAPGLFHRAVAGCGAGVVAEPIGAHPRVAELIARRYVEALCCRSPGIIEHATNL
ncbi:MAG TPA: sirohydrochlorin chelatase [Actinophytocola sp.]|uniref:sirohydrochlorin chelatase n=1 Tax=Actinophytocola sp. TaxID=1872138 RepID=UPI002DDD4EE1|nr:sirohydrochlorin chelatase [Actinophytocola sp.]HEV2781275.1 sirohydrochlorin chelatase [Actinophytocola sp.]